MKPVIRKYPIYAHRTMNGMCHVSFGGNPPYEERYIEHVEGIAFGNLEEFFGPQMDEASQMTKIEVITASPLPPEPVRENFYRIGWLTADDWGFVVLAEVIDDEDDVVVVPDGEHDESVDDLRQVWGDLLIPEVQEA